MAVELCDKAIGVSDAGGVEDPIMRLDRLARSLSRQGSMKMAARGVDAVSGRLGDEHRRSEGWNGGC
jgi:hypothetical protein